jgi:hypothetical protein
MRPTKRKKTEATATRSLTEGRGRPQLCWGRFTDAKEKDERERVVENKANDGRKVEIEDEIATYAKLAAKAKSETVVAQYEKYTKIRLRRSLSNSS